MTSTRLPPDESAGRWQLLVEHASVGLCLVDSTGALVYANPAAVAMYGASNVTELVGHSLVFRTPGLESEMSSLMSAIVEGAPPLVDHRCLLTRLDRSELPVQVSAGAVAFRGESAVQIELRDITRHLATEIAVRNSERRFRALFDDSPVAMALSDENGRWVELNSAFGLLLGRNIEDILGRQAQDFAHPDDHPIIAGSEQGQLDSPDGVFRTEVRLVHPDGSIIWAWITITPTPGPNGEKWTYAVGQDITSRKAMETSLRESERNLAAIAAVARCVQSGEELRPVVVQTIRSLVGATTVLMIEPTDTTDLAVTAAVGIEAVGTRVPSGELGVTSQVWRTRRPIFLSDIEESSLVNRSLAGFEETVSALWQPVVVDGVVLAVLHVTWTRRITDENDPAIRAVQVVADETGASLHAAQLRHELEISASTDPLTGTLNRRAWNAQMAVLVQQARDTGGALAIAMVDLDEFKSYNDSFGHTAGDALLSEFALAARDCLRSGDLFARWGGEEFIVALPNCSPVVAQIITQRIRRSMPAGRTCSIGLTMFDPAEDMSDCVARADAALYQAKARGRDQVAAH